MNRWKSSLAAVALLGLSGCYYHGVTDSVLAGTWPSEDGKLAALTYRAVDDMVEASPTLQRTGGPVVVMTIADIADIDHSTPFGNIVSDLVRTRLVQKGVPVTEMRLRNSVRLNRTDGELMLSRNRHALLPAPEAAELVTGTYAVGNSQIFVSLKIVEASDRRILAAADFIAPRSWNNEQLLLGSVASVR